MVVRYYEKGNKKLKSFGFPSYKKFNRRKQKMSDAYKKIESKIFKFVKFGDSIEGKLISKEKGNNFDNEVYKIQSGKETFVVFSTTVMQSQINEVPVGNMVKIVYREDKKSTEKGKNDTKLFDVYTKDAN